MIDGIRHEDALALSFSDASLDLIISQDVMEHVPEIEPAIAEAARVLRPGGRFYFSVPFDPASDTTVQRAKLSDGEVVHLKEPVFHGNPVSPEGSLVFFDHGWDLLDRLRGHGFAEACVLGTWSALYGYLCRGLLTVFRSYPVPTNERLGSRGDSRRATVRAVVSLFPHHREAADNVGAFDARRYAAADSPAGSTGSATTPRRSAAPSIRSRRSPISASFSPSKTTLAASSPSAIAATTRVDRSPGADEICASAPPTVSSPVSGATANTRRAHASAATSRSVSSHSPSACTWRGRSTPTPSARWTRKSLSIRSGATRWPTAAPGL